MGKPGQTPQIAPLFPIAFEKLPTSYRQHENETPRDSFLRRRSLAARADSEDPPPLMPLSITVSTSTLSKKPTHICWSGSGNGGSWWQSTTRLSCRHRTPPAGRRTAA